jgi:amidohydrolase
MESLKQEIHAYMDFLAGELADVNRFIFEHPEVAMNEKKTSSKLVEVLKKHGFEVKTPACGMETAFIAEASSGTEGPHIAFVAQYDALLDLGHACGHNLCSTASLGAALGLAKFLSRLNGRVSVMGTPSEEVLPTSGKVKMIGEGVFQDVDAAIATHPHSRTWLAEQFLAINQISIRFKGKSTHAGDTPHLGRNAYDAVQLTFIGLSFLRQQLRQDARVHWGEVEINGPMNVIPEAASAKIGLRASDDVYTEEITRKAVDCIKGAALMTGCEAEYETLEGYRSFKVNPTIVEEFRSNLATLEIPEDDPPEFGRGGSTDMGNISRVVPAIYPLFKITDNDPPHSSAFCTASGTDAAFETMIKMSKAMAATGARCLSDTGFLERIRKDFEKV